MEVDRVQAGSRFRREFDVCVQFFFFVSVVFFFRECLWVINVEAHAINCRMENLMIIPGKGSCSWTKRLLISDLVM